MSEKILQRTEFQQCGKLLVIDLHNLTSLLHFIGSLLTKVGDRFSRRADKHLPKARAILERVGRWEGVQCVPIVPNIEHA